MNRDEAKANLMLFRPGSRDADDPSFAEALEFCSRDPELSQWFEEHCAVYLALRAKFRQIEVPAGLKEQILAERKVHTAPAARRFVALVSAAAIFLVVTVFALRQIHSHEQTGLTAYLDGMASKALRAYDMDLRTADLDQIRSFLANHRALSDYAVPDALQRNAKATGCVATLWHDKPVTMICFTSGHPRFSWESNGDIWLFVTDASTVRENPGGPSVRRVNRVTAATWTKGNRTYVLMADGDEAFLKKYL